MSATVSEVRPGVYYDSVVLMQLQKSLSQLPGVIDAGVVMATPANCDILAAGNLLTQVKAGPDDLLIVVKGEDEAAARAALSRIDELLASRRSAAAQAFRPRSLDAAFKQLPEASWVLVSVPGRYAAGVADQALESGSHVFLYSDNVSIRDEVALKDKASEKGLFMLGPDCGTAIINQIGLGFANRVRSGNIGIAAASGTGLQHVSSTIHNLGGGISQAFGTGGRDLSAAVGGRTTRQVLNFLAGDDKTEVIVLLSKPPEGDVAKEILMFALAIGKPIVVDFIGYLPPARRLGNLHFAASLEDAASLAWEIAQAPCTSKAGYVVQHSSKGEARCFRGLFSGGTLAYEALLSLSHFFAPLYANISIKNVTMLDNPMQSTGNTIVDLGSDEFTQGRLHPMMDNDLRIRRLQSEAKDPEVSTIILDLVTGEGAHPDPASELAPEIQEAIRQANHDGKELEVIVVAVGTDEDPQGFNQQAATLQNAGAIVYRKMSEFLEHVIIKHVSSSEAKKEGRKATLKPGFAAVNTGLEIFHDSIKAQGGQVVQVDWRPPAGGKEDLMALLAKMR